MSREILFRGKTNDGQWLEGDLMQYAGTSQIWVQTDEGKWNFVVDPATVGQFTGLCDDKGKKVFEGDIIDVRARFKSEVCFIARNAGYLLKDNHGWQWLFDVLASMPCEVIGNIHDNPELLKEESK